MIAAWQVVLIDKHHLRASRRLTNAKSIPGACYNPAIRAVTGSELRDELLNVISDPKRVSDGDSVRRLHGESLIGSWSALPDVVVFPRSAAEVSAVLALANDRRVPVVPFGAGSSAEGECIPVAGGISLDTTLLTSLQLRPADLQATVGAGVTRSALNAAAGEHGLSFPVDPGADATIGGMTATNASGTTTVRYGSMRQNVLEVEVVLADGSIVRAGAKTAKTSAGYNLAHLFIGSEGTLGVIVSATVRLHGIPEHIVAIRASFPTLDSACACAAALVGAGVPLVRAELIDGGTVGAINTHAGTELPERPHLFLELGGSRTAVEADLGFVRDLAAEHGCDGLSQSADPTERSRLWAARHGLFFAHARAYPGKAIKGTDTAVPISQLAAAVQYAREVIEAAGLEPIVVAHAGDGNYHCVFAVDGDDPEQQLLVQRVNDEIVRDCLARGGTCSGEHGIGLGKIHALEAEHGDLLPLMRGIKDLLDPNGILNPGKILASPTPSATPVTSTDAP